jgi:hypothetical protein
LSDESSFFDRASPPQSNEHRVANRRVRGSSLLRATGDGKRLTEKQCFEARSHTIKKCNELTIENYANFMGSEFGFDTSPNE